MIEYIKGQEFVREKCFSVYVCLNRLRNLTKIIRKTKIPKLKKS